MSYDIYTGLLQAFPLRTESQAAIHFSYDTESPAFLPLKSRYPIEQIAGDGGDFSKAVNLLHWVSGHTCHKGDYNGVIANNARDLLDYAYDKGIDYGINCVSLAKILTECLLAVGLTARSVYLMPCSPYDSDCHCVTHAYIRERRQWVMLDPTMNAYFTNEQGDCLSLLGLRDHLAEQAPVYFNKEAAYNGQPLTGESQGSNLEYYAKNLFFFQTQERSAFGNGCGEETAGEIVPVNRYITLCPEGYDPKRVRLSNIAYRVRLYGDDPTVPAWIESTKREIYTYCSAAEFEDAPSPAE